MDAVRPINIIHKSGYNVHEKIQAAQFLFSFQEEIIHSISSGKLDLKGRFLGPNEIRILVALLKQQDNIKELYLGNNCLGDDGAIALVEYLKDNKTLQVLNLQNVGIGDVGITALSKAFADNSSLEYLDLYYNKISPRGVKALADSLKTSDMLKVLNLRYNALADHGIKAIGKLISSSNCTIQKLYLGANQITNMGVKYLSLALEKNIGLQVLDVGTNSFSSTAVEIICSSIIKHPNFHTLNIERNRVGDKGAGNLAKYFERGLRLKSLNLKYCQINSNGIVSFCRGLKDNKHIEELYLGGNILRLTGAKAIFEMLTANSSLHILDLENCDIWIDGAEALAKAILYNQTLQDLRLQWNTLRDKGIEIIADALKQNKSLKKLNLEKNSISDKGIKAIAAATMLNSVLLDINLDYNSFTPSVESYMMIISNKLLRNSTQTQLSPEKFEIDNNIILKIINAAKKMLFKQMGQDFEWGVIEQISEKERRNLILRANVMPSHRQLSSIIIKKIVRGKDDVWDASRFINDSTATQFLSALQKNTRYSPLFYGADIEHEFFMLEDMGKVHISLVDYLAAEVPRSKINKIFKELSKTLSHMHSATLNKRQAFNLLYKTNNTAIGSKQTFSYFNYEIQQVREKLIPCIEKIYPKNDMLLKEINDVFAGVIEPKSFDGFVHGDLCPDNLFVRKGKVLIFDFESGHYGHIFLDLACLRMNFPSCWCAQRLPNQLIIQFEQEYRKQFPPDYSYINEDNIFYPQLALCCAYWLFKTLANRLPEALKNDKQWGISSIRQRILAQLSSFKKLALNMQQYTATVGMADAMIKRLSDIWDDISPLPIYPVFKDTKVLDCTNI